MARTRECRDCDQPIEFMKTPSGKWMPVNLGTTERHRCQLDQTCTSCQKSFKGAPWMTLCPDCYRAGGTPSRRAQGGDSRPRTREDLKPGAYDDDDQPF